MRTEKILIQFSISVTDQDIDDIMAAALEGGICYWCGDVDVVGKRLGRYASDQISKGGKLILYDAEEDDRYELTREKFMSGLKMWLENGGADRISDGGLEVSEIDADDADAIVQYALFGEVVYG